MKNLKKILSLLMAVLMVAGLLAACGGGGGDETKDTTPVDPSKPYDETVKLTTFFEIAAPIQNTFDESQLKEYKLLKDMQAATNIELEYLWCAADTAEDAEQKKQNAIATGDIPDFMLVDSAQLALLAKSDLINKDLQGLYDTYASETMKKWTEAEGKDALGSAMFNGKLVAIPLVQSASDSAPLLWIRKDWLDNLGLEVPTTMEQLYAVMKAFKENDPDKDGAADTVGIALHKNFLSNGTGDCYGLFNGFGSYPTSWVEDGNGGLVYGATTAESKAALEYLAKAYKEGLIAEDFSVKDDSGTMEQTASSVAGIQYGMMWNAMWPLNMTSANDPAADWCAVAIPGVEALGTPGTKLSLVGYAVISAECEHPEAVFKLINYWCYIMGEASLEEYNSILVESDGVPQVPQHHVMLKTWNPLKNLEAYYHVKEAIENGNDPSKLNAEEMGYYNDVVAYMNGDMSKFGPMKTFGPTGSAYEAMAAYAEAGNYYMDKFTGPSTPTMGKNMSTVEDKVYEYYTKVIMGVESIDTFDAFVAELGTLGLTQITTEVNEWYASK